MDSADDQGALLEQLQSQVNLVLEQTGRVFAAVATKPTERPTAQIVKLKNTLPVATNTFHNALDQLESQLQLASLVMRRDLALCRERAGTLTKVATPPSQPQKNEEADSMVGIQTNADSEDANASPNREPITAAQPPSQDDDVAMTDTSDPKTNVIEKSASEPDSSVPAASATAIPSPSPAAAKPSVVAHTLPTATTDAKSAANTPLQLDTSAAENPQTQDQPSTADDDKPPDTANDLDSLFNDPTSADANDTSNDFSFNDNSTVDMVDFSNFGPGFDSNADNDNISSLIPGLEDYANNEPGSAGELDFNSIFDVGAGDNGSNNDAMNSQGAGEQRDTTFDDLMDLANFDATGMEGDGAGADGTTAEFDFDSLFN